MKDTNMKCTEIRELLPELAARVASTATEVNLHLGSCTDCAEKLNEFRKTMALLDEWQSPEPSPYFDVRLHARLREEAAKQPISWLAWMRRPAMAVSLAVALVAGVTVWMGRQSGISNEPDQPGTAVSDLQVQQDVRANP